MGYITDRRFNSLGLAGLYSPLRRVHISEYLTFHANELQYMRGTNGTKQPRNPATKTRCSTKHENCEAQAPEGLGIITIVLHHACFALSSEGGFTVSESMAAAACTVLYNPWQLPPVSLCVVFVCLYCMLVTIICQCARSRMPCVLKLLKHHPSLNIINRNRNNSPRL